MTFSILARDPGSGAIGGAAATGNLCVGGWVLRGDPRSGISASQGAAPSVFWGEDVLAQMRDGLPAARAVTAVTAPDSGRDWRQLAALDPQGGAGAFTGARNTPAMGERFAPGAVVAGNLLTGPGVLDAALQGLTGAEGRFADRLLAGLRAGARAGGDSRGLMSAALLILSPDMPPLTLRIDHSATPLDDLEALLARAMDPAYAGWLTKVPVLSAPHRAPEDPRDGG